MNRGVEEAPGREGSEAGRRAQEDIAANTTATIAVPARPGTGLKAGRPLFQNLLNLWARHRQTVDVLAQPLREVRFDRVGPAAVDLSGGVGAGTQPGMSELIPQPRDLRRAHDLLRELRRNEDHTAVPAQHHITRHHERTPNPNRHVDTNHRRVEARSGAGVADVVRRVVGADKRREVLHIPQAVDVANGAVVDNAVAGLRVDRASDVVTDGGAVLLESEMIGHVHVTRLEHVHGPRVGPTDSTGLAALGFDHPQDVGPAGQPLRGQGAADEHLLWVNRQPLVVVLMREAGAGDDRPCFLERHGLHPVEDRVRYVRPAVGKALALPVRRVFNQLLRRQHTRLSVDERRGSEQEGGGDQRSRHGVPHRYSV